MTTPALIAISSWEWIVDNRAEILHLLLQHLQLTVIAVLVGFAISFPLAVLAYRHRALYPPITWITGLLYTIPAIGLFVLLLPFTGLSVTTAEIGLVSYTLLILIRNTVAGLRAVPEDVKEAARGMGYTNRQMLWRVELPLSVPYLAAGFRTAAVQVVATASLAALVAGGGLGQIISEGFGLTLAVGGGQVVAGGFLVALLALLVEGTFAVVERLVTPRALRPGRSMRKAGATAANV